MYVGKRKEFMTREEAMAVCERNYPLGSEWIHVEVINGWDAGLGRVTVCGYDVMSSPADSCGYSVSPAIRDKSGRRWDCYSPHTELIR